MSPAFQKLKGFFKNIFISLAHLELRKRKIADIIPHAGYYEFVKDSDANNMTVQQYYRETYNIHISNLISSQRLHHHAPNAFGTVDIGDSWLMETQSRCKTHHRNSAHKSHLCCNRTMKTKQKVIAHIHHGEKGIAESR